jgi:hypothetical protein
MLRTNRSSLIRDRVEYGTIHVHSIDCIAQLKSKADSRSSELSDHRRAIDADPAREPVSLNSCRAMASPPMMQ